MGKYLPPIRGKFKYLIYHDPADLAKKVVDNWKTAVTRYVNQMTENYENGLSVWATDEIKQGEAVRKIAEYYNKLQPIAAELRETMDVAREGYKRELARELYRG